MSDPAPFPAELAQVPEGERILEAFGWAPAGWALACFTLVQLGALQPARLEKGEILGLALVFLGGLALAIHEARRRRWPKALVRRGPQVAVYLKGHLARQVEVSACTLYLRHPTKTWGGILYLGGTAVTAGLFVVPGILDLGWPARLTAALVMGASGSLCASLIRTRLLCEEALVPHGRGGYQHILVHKRDIPRIFRPGS